MSKPLFNIVAVFRPAILLKKRIQHRCFPVNFAKFYEQLFYRTLPGGCFWQHVSIYPFYSKIRNTPTQSYTFFLEISLQSFYFFNISGLLPEFTTAPSAIATNDGFTYITGCTYTIKEDLGVDLAEFSFLLINNEVKIKLIGGSRKLTTNMFQLPSSRFIIPGKYKCIIEAKHFYDETISSTLSTDIQMPGMYIL